MGIVMSCVNVDDIAFDYVLLVLCLLFENVRCS